MLPWEMYPRKAVKNIVTGAGRCEASVAAVVLKAMWRCATARRCTKTTCCYGLLSDQRRGQPWSDGLFKEGGGDGDGGGVYRWQKVSTLG